MLPPPFGAGGGARPGAGAGAGGGAGAGAGRVPPTKGKTRRDPHNNIL